MLQRALGIWEEQLGLRHPNTTTSLNNLTSLYWQQGKYTEAEPLYQRALAIREQSLGPEHPDTALSQSWLAYLMEEQGKAQEALRLYAQAVSVFEETLGKEHPSTQNVRWYYERCLQRVRQMEPPDNG